MLLDVLEKDYDDIEAHMLFLELSKKLGSKDSMVVAAREKLGKLMVSHKTASDKLD